jgi:hypothetical protein
MREPGVERLDDVSEAPTEEIRLSWMRDINAELKSGGRAVRIASQELVQSGQEVRLPRVIRAEKDGYR